MRITHGPIEAPTPSLVSCHWNAVGSVRRLGQNAAKYGGTTNTILIAEQSGAVNKVSRSANYLGGWFSVANTLPTSITAGTSFPPTTTGFWYAGGLTTVRYPPNAYTNSTSPPTAANNQGSFNTVTNSFHTGGINIVLADGSVRFLSENVDFTTYRYLSCRDDGQVIGEF